jgi:hypothetical protein
MTMEDWTHLPSRESEARWDGCSSCGRRSLS